MVTQVKHRKIAGIPPKAGLHFRNPPTLALGTIMIEALTACQARGARAMLDWSARELAKRSKVSESSIRRIEEGFGVPENVSLDLRVKLQEYFEGRGFTFRWDEHLGAGVYWNRTGKRERRSGLERRQGGPV
jgi:DNA-binding XRE family transcriptional regulator